jgi:sec-independent protein translocase protein TatB
LLVLGPERLPRVARTTGALLRKARQSWHSVRSEIERELAAEDLRQTIRDTAAAADPTSDLRRIIEPPAAPPPPAAPSAAPAPDDAGHDRR